jgi:hypothetical protein
MSDHDRLRIALQLTQHLRVRALYPGDDGYVGDGLQNGYAIDGIAEAAEAFAKKDELLLRLIESAERHLRVAIGRDPLQVAERLSSKAVEICSAHSIVESAVRLLRDGEVPARMREGAG